VSKCKRVLRMVLSGAAVALSAVALPAVVLPAGTAQAAALSPVYIYTAGTLAECTTTGGNGVGGGVFAGYSCQSGFAGYSLSVRPTLGHTGKTVYLNTMTASKCQSAGMNGVVGGVFTGFSCQSGFVGYSLMVRD